MQIVCHSIFGDQELIGTINILINPSIVANANQFNWNLLKRKESRSVRGTHDLFRWVDASRSFRGPSLLFRSVPTADNFTRVRHNIAFLCFAGIWCCIWCVLCESATSLTMKLNIPICYRYWRWIEKCCIISALFADTQEAFVVGITAVICLLQARHIEFVAMVSGSRCPCIVGRIRRLHICCFMKQ
jgi:hypothetical protein